MCARQCGDGGCDLINSFTQTPAEKGGSGMEKVWVDVRIQHCPGGVTLAWGKLGLCVCVCLSVFHRILTCFPLLVRNSQLWDAPTSSHIPRFSSGFAEPFARCFLRFDSSICSKVVDTVAMDGGSAGQGWAGVCVCVCVSVAWLPLPTAEMVSITEHCLRSFHCPLHTV